MGGEKGGGGVHLTVAPMGLVWFGLVRWLRGEAVNGYCDDGDFTDLCFVWKKEGEIPVLACTTESTKFCIQRK